jgi:hypothetical protein
MRLICIHGRQQNGKVSRDLRQIWLDTWQEGLKTAGLSYPSDLEFIFPFYGDLLDSLIHQLPNTIEGVIERGAAAPGKVEFFEALLADLADNANIPLQQFTSENGVPVKERGPLNWNWVQAILRGLEHSERFGNLSLRKFTYDVYCYLTIPGIRRQIDNLILKALREGPAVVVGHSLGSVVGYNVLANHNGFVRKYITLGSPLGVKSIKNHLTRPLKMPICVEDGWFNAYDDRDVVALRPLDNHTFDILPPIVNKNDVKNKTDNRHGIEGYLNDPEVARIILEALG